MATSGVTDNAVTARDLATFAMQELRILPSGGSPKAAELADIIVRLNAMMKSWQAKGVNLWREATDTVTVLANTPSVTLNAGIRDVNAARVVLTATNQREMAKWARADYRILPNKAAVGSPTIFYVARLRDAAVMYVWPVPNTNTVIQIDIDRIAETVTDPVQNLDIPQEWQEAVYSNLAVRIAGMFGAELNQELVARAVRLERELLDADRPDSYQMYPDA